MQHSDTENGMELTVTGRSAATLAALPVMDMETALERRKTIQQFVSKIMVEGEDFGVIPGTKSKPSLLKPGAEKLASFFGLAPEFDVTKRMENWALVGTEEPFFFYEVKCRLIRDGVVRGEGLGSCNSRESKFRWRNAERLCPQCGQSTIIKGKADYGGGWVCFAKKGGCNAKFKDGDQSIEGQSVGRVPNPDIADQVNVILKRAKKRALVDAVLNTVGASQFFTQDVEDMATTPGAVDGAAGADNSHQAFQHRTEAAPQPRQDDDPYVVEEQQSAGQRVIPTVAQQKDAVATGPRADFIRMCVDLCEKCGLQLPQLACLNRVKEAELGYLGETDMRNLPRDPKKHVHILDAFNEAVMDDPTRAELFRSDAHAFGVAVRFWVNLLTDDSAVKSMDHVSSSPHPWAKAFGWDDLVIQLAEDHAAKVLKAKDNPAAEARFRTLGIDQMSRESALGYFTLAHHNVQEASGLRLFCTRSGVPFEDAFVAVQENYGGPIDMNSPSDKVTDSIKSAFKVISSQKERYGEKASR